MYQETLSTREVLHDLTMMGSSLVTLLNKGKEYDKIIRYIIDNKFYYNLYQSIPLKKLAQEMGFSYQTFQNLIHQIYRDALDYETEYRIEIKDVEYQITLDGFKHTAYLILKSLPILPRIGEEVQIAFFKTFVGEEYFYVKNIRHELYDNQQVISIHLEGGHYNKWWHYRRDEAIEKGEVDEIEAWFSSDRSLKKEIGVRRR
jgi:AraC-like DNA-binding protein